MRYPEAIIMKTTSLFAVAVAVMSVSVSVDGANDAQRQLQGEETKTTANIKSETKTPLVGHVASRGPRKCKARPRSRTHFKRGQKIFKRFGAGRELCREGDNGIFFPIFI